MEAKEASVLLVLYFLVLCEYSNHECITTIYYFNIIYLSDKITAIF